MIINNVYMISPEQHALTKGFVLTGTEMECIALALINQFNTYAQDFEERESGMDADEHEFILDEMTRVKKMIRKLEKESGFMWIGEEEAK